MLPLQAQLLLKGAKATQKVSNFFLDLGKEAISSTVGLAASGISSVAGLAASGLSKMILVDEEEAKQPETETIEMPYLISIDPYKKEKFENHVNNIGKRKGIKYKIKIEEPNEEYEIVKIPKELKNDETSLSEILNNVKEFELKTGKRTHIIYI